MVGKVALHTDGNASYPTDTVRFVEGGIDESPYQSVSGEVFNVLYSDSSPEIYFLQPQMSDDILIPLNKTFVEEFRALWKETGKIGMDLLYLSDAADQSEVEVV